VHFSTIEVFVASPMTRWEFRIVPCLAGGNASATCLKMLVMRFADVQWPAPLNLLRHFVAQYKSLIIIILVCWAVISGCWVVALLHLQLQPSEMTNFFPSIYTFSTALE